MEIFTTLNDLRIEEKTSVALGNFDGLHIGHRKVMESALQQNEKFKTLCFTFSNHPFNYILGRNSDDPAALKMICSEEDKISLIEQMGFDILVNVPFDENIMKMRAHDFFNNILIDKLNAGYISVGFNYSYGARAEGKPEILKQECIDAGIGINISDAVTVDGNVVSSTLIRKTIEAGDMEKVRKYLGRPLIYGGKVEHGNKLGSTKGYPTANIPVAADRMTPPNGVYFSRTSVDGKIFNSVSNIGVKPTINEDISDIGKSIETYLFDFEGDLYGSDIKVYMDHFSRGELKFRSRDELFEQIARDCQNALDHHKTISKN